MPGCQAKRTAAQLELCSRFPQQPQTAGATGRRLRPHRPRFGERGVEQPSYRPSLQATRSHHLLPGRYPAFPAAAQRSLEPPAYDRGGFVEGAGASMLSEDGGMPAGEAMRQMTMQKNTHSLAQQPQTIRATGCGLYPSRPRPDQRSVHQIHHTMVLEALFTRLLLPRKQPRREASAEQRVHPQQEGSVDLQVRCSRLPCRVQPA